jgi:hypothetical protein
LNLTTDGQIVKLPAWTAGAPGTYTLEISVEAGGTLRKINRALLVEAGPKPDNTLGNPLASLHTFSLCAVPNPCTDWATIAFSLPGPDRFSLRLYDVTGRTLATLANGYHNAGFSTLSFQPSTLSLVSGIYLLRLECEGRCTTEKLIVR